MKRLIRSLIKEEAKQVGTLYHFTNLYNLLFILEEDSLKSRNDWVSFTRNKNFAKIDRILPGGDINCILIINGDSLSNNYKIEPYHDQKFFRERDFGTDKMEQEEKVLGPISPIKSYIENIILLKNEIKNWEIQNIYYKQNGENVPREDSDKYSIEDIKNYIQNTYGINVNIE